MAVLLSEVLTKDRRLLGTAVYPSGERKGMIGPYRATYSGDGAELTGIQVIDEFETISGPVMICPTTQLGLAYDLALTAAFERSSELELGSGWPPVVIGLDVPVAPAPSMLVVKRSGVVEVVLIGIGPGQAVILVVVATELRKPALDRLAQVARSMLRSPKTLALAISTAMPTGSEFGWSETLDRDLRAAITAALDVPESANPDQ